MNKELHDLLCAYLGELMHKHENTFYCMEKDAITRKINAVNELLDIDSRTKTFREKNNGNYQDQSIKQTT